MCISLVINTLQKKTLFAQGRQKRMQPKHRGAEDSYSKTIGLYLNLVACTERRALRAGPVFVHLPNKYLPYGMLRYVTGRTISDVSKNRCFFIFRSKQYNLFVPLSLDCMTLKMGVTTSLPESVTIYKSIRRNVPEGLKFYRHSCESITYQLRDFLYNLIYICLVQSVG